MMFDSIGYWVFFFVVEACVVAFSRDKGKLMLVVASFFFYGCWDYRFDFLLGGSVIANFLIGLRVIDKQGNARREWLIAGIAVNLLMLGFFKYYNFFAASVAAALGLPPDHWALAIILPVGISFYSFEGIAYLADIYKKQVEARRNLVDFALFLSFFPHLISGPIIRPHHFFPQVGHVWTVTRADIRWSFIQIVKGLFKKCVLADTMAGIADSYFNGGHDTAAIVGTLAFTLQIYFDFSGYTDIARGCALLLGYRFPSNFERPYFAPSIGDFWRRWHISLSTWLRDYLYIPLGGNRSGRAAQYRNYLIVMGLGGLWHGASWNFLIWGLYHGTLLLGHRVFTDYAPQNFRAFFATRIGRVSGIGATFALVMLGWIPFRAGSFTAAWNALSEIFTRAHYGLHDVPSALAIVAVGSWALCLLDKDRRIQNWLSTRAPWGVYLGCVGAWAWLTVLFAHRGSSIPFIYFQF